MKEAIVTAILAGIGIIFLPLFAFALAPTAQAQTMCTMQYDPVCGAQPVQCITTPCYPQYQTYGNACMAGAAGAKIIHKGECLPHETGPVIPQTRKPYEPSPYCQAWFDGCNSCSRTQSGIVCTKRACSADNTQTGYCIAWSNPVVRPPVPTSTPPVYVPPVYTPPVYIPPVYHPPVWTPWWHWTLPWQWNWRFW